jgi:hypothetical protein
VQSLEFKPQSPLPHIQRWATGFIGEKEEWRTIPRFLIWEWIHLSAVNQDGNRGRITRNGETICLGHIWDAFKTS